MKVQSSVVVVINRYVENNRQKHKLVGRHFGRLIQPSSGACFSTVTFKRN